jgi:hypothetical protein
MKFRRERRKATRYPLEMGALASVEEIFNGSPQFEAIVRNISSRGALFESEGSFDKEDPVSLLINFTEKLATDYSTRLLVRGQIIRKTILPDRQTGQYGMEFSGRWKFVREENSPSA